MVPTGLTSVRSPEQAAGRGAANGRPVSPWWATPPDPAPALEEVYDARTLAALDTGVEPAWEDDEATVDRPPPGFRGSIASGAVLAGLMLGMREVFDPEATREPVFELAPDPGLQPVDGVTLYFVPGDPEATVAVVRRSAGTA